MVRSQALFGVALFMLGASLASSSFAGAITALTMIPAMLIFEAISITDIVVSIVAIFAAKKYGPKTLIASSVVSGLNTVLRAVAVTMLVFFLFGSGKPYPGVGNTATPNEDETRTQYNLPSNEFPSFAPGSERPPRPHGPGGPGERPPRPHGPGGPGGPGDRPPFPGGECPPLPADLPPFPGPGELPPFPGDVPPFPGGPGGPGRPGHCGPGFPGGPGRPGHPGGPGNHDGQDPREDNEQEPGRGEQGDEHQSPRRGREEETNRETDQQDTRMRQARSRPGSNYVGYIAPYFSLALACWALGLNIAIFVLSVVHTRRVMTQSKSSTTATTTVNGKVYSELTSKV
jgi:hypothetical protein